MSHQTLPPQRSEEERLRHHFEVERRLADRLRHSTREERTELFKELYNELFRLIPDHPRLTRRDTPEESRRSVLTRLRLLEGLLGRETVLVEFAPGDCRLAYAAAEQTRAVYGIDISDQSGEDQTVTPPGNFTLIVYDGYRLDLNVQADVLFSYQFLEHLHFDDIDLHFELAYRLLKPGGCYVFSTPHCFSGPHDVSRHFSDEPLGFHFKEWTYAEMLRVLKKAGFSSAFTFRFGKARRYRLANAVTLLTEWLIGKLPRRLQKKASRRLFEAVTMIAIK